MAWSYVAPPTKKVVQHHELCSRVEGTPLAFARLWNDVWWIGDLPSAASRDAKCNMASRPGPFQNLNDVQVQEYPHLSNCHLFSNTLHFSWFRPTGQSVASSEEPTSVEASSGCFTTRPGRISRTSRKNWSFLTVPNCFSGFRAHSQAWLHRTRRHTGLAVGFGFKGLKPRQIIDLLRTTRYSAQPFKTRSFKTLSYRRGIPGQECSKKLLSF